jgi:hypothetical protein
MLQENCASRIFMFDNTAYPFTVSIARLCSLSRESLGVMALMGWACERVSGPRRSLRARRPVCRRPVGSRGVVTALGRPLKMGGMRLLATRSWGRVLCRQLAWAARALPPSGEGAIARGQAPPRAEVGTARRLRVHGWILAGEAGGRALGAGRRHGSGRPCARPKGRWAKGGTAAGVPPLCAPEGARSGRLRSRLAQSSRTGLVDPPGRPLAPPGRPIRAVPSQDCRVQAARVQPSRPQGGARRASQL